MKNIINKGVLLTLSYIGMAGTANVMLASYLKQYDPFCVTAICFLATTAYFTLLNQQHLPRIYQLYQTYWQDFMLLNVYASINWLAFYGALSVLEPVVVITIVNVVGTIVNHLASPKHSVYLCGYGIALLILFVHSVAPHWPNKIEVMHALGALFLAPISGYAIVKTVVLSKRLYQAGLQVGEVMSVRFYLLILVCVVKLICFPNAQSGLNLQDVGMIIFLGGLSIVAPVYVLQLAYLHATTKQVLLTLSFAPLFIFVLQFAVTAHRPAGWVALSVMLVSLTSSAIVSLQKIS